MQFILQYYVGFILVVIFYGALIIVEWKTWYHSPEDKTFTFFNYINLSYKQFPVMYKETFNVWVIKQCETNYHSLLERMFRIVRGYLNINFGDYSMRLIFSSKPINQTTFIIAQHNKLTGVIVICLFRGSLH